MALVSLDQARAHCRVEPDYPAEQLEVYLGAAEDHASAFLGRKVYESAEKMAAAILDGTAGENPIVVNKSIQAAVLLLTGHLFANRENSVVGVTVAVLPTGFDQLLMPYRVGMGV